MNVRGNLKMSKKSLISLEDLAAIRLSGRSTNPECLCDEYSSLILSQAAEIKRLKAELDAYLELAMDEDENHFIMG